MSSSAMAQAQDHAYNHSSPRSSSGGAESFKGTPDTRLTAFSPDGGSARSTKHLKELSLSGSGNPPLRLPVNSSRGIVSHMDKDPFVTPTHGQGSRLSPTASDFQPASSHVQSSSDTSISLPVSAFLSHQVRRSRFLSVTAADLPLSSSEVEAWLADQEKAGCQLYSSRHLATSNGAVFLYFPDIRDAIEIHARLRVSGRQWKVEHVDVATLARDKFAPFEESAGAITQVSVVAVLHPGSTVNTEAAMNLVGGFLETHGRLFALVRHATHPDGSFRAVAEFCHSSATLAVLASCARGVLLGAIEVIVMPFIGIPMVTAGDELADSMQSLALARHEPGRREDVPASSTPRTAHSNELRSPVSYPVYPIMFQPRFPSNAPYMMDRYVPSGPPGSVTAIAPVAPMSPPSYQLVGPLYQTPPSPALTSQHSFSPSRSSSGFTRGDGRRQHASRVNRSPYHNAAGHHNHVDIGRIREGIDVRTTIMLRNIPNKVDQAMLKGLVDESSWGKYDFMYLRIDFANECNVGYAFINFVDPLDIIDFVDARGNQRWNCFKSDKVAEISYATIQGKDCLVQKFRNSSVMLEASHYRPKLYYTSNGPTPEYAGQEEPFPEPDNQSKMKRSCENAEHVGLFTPNAGQHFRDEQRRRRSQFDRGTRLAQLEEGEYDYTIQLYGTPAR